MEYYTLKILYRKEKYASRSQFLHHFKIMILDKKRVLGNNHHPFNKKLKVKMIKNWDKNIIYRSAVTPGQRRNLLAAYCDYITFCKNLEYTLKHFQMKVLASYGFSKLFPNCLEKRAQWDISSADITETDKYNKYVNNMPPTKESHYCYVSLNLTTKQGFIPKSRILAGPKDFLYENNGNTLPHRIERYIAIYPSDEKVEDIKFIVGGRYKLSYLNKDDRTLKEAFQDQNFRNQFLCFLDVITQVAQKERFVEKLPHLDFLKMQTEAFASYVTSSTENIVLDSLALLAEETNKTLNNLLAKRYGTQYLSQAEKDKLIPSAVNMQDYLHIRHLIHHQWDTLDSVGKFSGEKAKRNESMRSRFLDSYRKICDKSIHQRFESYVRVVEDFTPLVKILNPNLIIRDKDESNTKFLKRIQEYITANPTSEVYVETRLSYGAKKDAFIKNIEKLYPRIIVVDKMSCSEAELSDLSELTDSYNQRRRYIEEFQNIEYQVCQFCLFSGANKNSYYAWNYLVKNEIISPEEAQKWAEYKKLRNDISHKYLDKELIAQIARTLDDMESAADKLSAHLDKLLPDIDLVEDGGNIYQATHHNGKIVMIDMSAKKILSITDPSRNFHQFNNHQKASVQKKKKFYTEEYNNGTSITVSGTSITSCRLNNGVEIDFEKHCIKYDDNTHIYFSNPQRRYLTTPRDEKIIMDENFAIINYINRGKSIEIRRSEFCSLYNDRKIEIDSNLSIASEIWKNKKNKRMIVKYYKTDSGIELHFNDKTVITINKDEATAAHNNLKLSYETRKIFAESYQENTINPALLLKKQKEKN